MHFPHLVWFLGEDLGKMEKVAHEAYPTATMCVVKNKMPNRVRERLNEMAGNGTFPKHIETLVFVTRGIVDVPHMVRMYIDTLHLFPWKFSDSRHFDELNFENLSQEEFDQRCTLSWAENRAAVFVELDRQPNKKSSTPIFGQEIKISKPEPVYNVVKTLKWPTEPTATQQTIGRDSIGQRLSRIEKGMALLLEHFGIKLPNE